MKKLLTISLLFVMMLAMSTTMVHATTSAELPDALMAIARKYGATDADKIKLERYLADNPVSEAEANAIVAKANEAAKVMEDAGVTNVKDLTDAQKAQVKAIANEAAGVVGVTLVFTNDTVNPYKDGKLIDVTPASSNGGSSAAAATTSGAKLVYTGNNGNILFAIGGAIIALSAIVVIGKKVVNE